MSNKRLRNYFPVLLTLALIMVLFGAACSSEEDKGPIILIEQDWDGQLVTTAVAKILLEEEMGYTVEQKFAAADSAAMFAGLESGEFHLACCNWPSFSAGFIEDFVDNRGAVERIGSTGILGSNGWFVPRYVIEGDSARGISPVAPNLASYGDMNQYTDVFATTETGEKGRLLDFTPAWDYRNQERLDALGVDFEVFYSGSETASFAEIDAAYQRGAPFFMVMWAPHWSHTKYDMVEIQLPQWTEECYPSGGNFDCGWPSDDVAKLAWPGFEEDFPEAYEFFQNFTITNVQQNEMVLAVTDDGKDYAEAAQDWVDANEDIWSAWIP
ncbi:MAG: glycine betaine ABC transporter substrate-binding protein [Dehalococcoidia bacterium]|nr:glycine betaine ABC transporter substrate-binding protein [Dehalococcoidia bacterium]